VDGSGFTIILGVEAGSPAVLRARARPVEGGTVSERERGMVVVTVDWNAGTVSDVVLVVLVVVVTAAPVPEFTIEPFCAAGLNAPPPLSGKRGAEDPTVVEVNGWTGAANGVAAPASGNGLKTLIPVAGVGGAVPTIGEGLYVVGDVASGADPPRRGKGLKTLPPPVTFVCPTVEVVTVVC